MGAGSVITKNVSKNSLALTRAEQIEVNKYKIPFRIPSGISFVKIDTQTGLQTDKKNGILESFIKGTEPFNKKIRYLIV